MIRAAAKQLKATHPRSRLFSNSAAVLAQPPPLQQTLDRYLKTAQPLLEPPKFEEAVKKVEAFGTGLGATLQERLIAKDSFVSSDSIQGRDLASRIPLCVKSNWWFQLNDHPNHPKTLVAKPPPTDVISSFQIERAAGLIHNMLGFKEHIQANSSASSFENMFSTSRIPQEAVDAVSEPVESKHIVVMIKNQMYKLEIVDSEGKMATLKELQRLLFAIGASSLETEVQPNVGLLTSTNRNEWAENSTKLASLSPANASNLTTLSSSLFVLCLDDHSTIANPNYSHLQFMHNATGQNRWFDKPVQVILASSGRAGINAEVSTVDAAAHAKLAEYLANNEPVVEKPAETLDALFPQPVKLKWEVDSEIEAAISAAESKVVSLARSTESVMMQSEIFGERYINQIARSDTDAFMQLALEITWQRLHKTATNSSLTRVSPETSQFVSGTTASQECWDFVATFDNDDILYDDKRAKFRAAVDSLVESTSTLSSNTETHIASLHTVTESATETQELESIFGPLSTSRKYGLDCVNYGAGKPFVTGFAQSWANGYGVAYSIGMDDVKVSVCNKKGGKTSAFRFVDTLKRTFADMMILFPKRSSVWGYDWREKFARKRKEEYYLKTMKKLSDDYMAGKDGLAKKYASQIRK
ncbi:Carnitine O-acetyltransferase mitochondrial [Podochytrium sp. JEL0797]|nr:Carnitine O-acetyltransferase mitochondrial [Podochytrium sp. JEL0797]